MDPITAAIIASTIATGASAIGNASQGRAQEKENRLFRQSQQRKEALINELLSSIEGKGRFSDLFSRDEGTFQKSFVEPALSRFRNQVAPQIQQSSIAGGMQRSSTLDDQLSRAGVDLDQMLNQQFANFQQQGQHNMSSILSAILGGQAPMPLQAPPTLGQTIGAGATGFLQSPAFAEMIKNSGNTTTTGDPRSTIASQPTTMTQGQIDILNPPVARNLDASRNPRAGFAFTG